MTPQPSIAHYRITQKLGQGGMGEVWRATDTKLGRDVAIKMLPAEFAADPDRMVRFQREAQVLASLNHPNIAAIYGVEERALIMELVDGPTLAERIAQGPAPLDEALAIARQVAEALEYAHEKGIVHRDLKPANIKLTADGRVKVLDFGLAKAISGDVAASGDSINSPTLTMRATAAGLILGTAGYMAPEQAKGKPVDKRADIWAFGVVLYEMLSGEAPFAGETVSDTLAAVLTKDLDFERVPPETRKLLRSCLERDPKRRLRDIGDASRLLEEAAPPSPGARLGQSRPLQIVAAVLVLALASTATLLWRVTRPADHPLLRLEVDLGPDALAGVSTTVAISPDGRRLVFPVHAPGGNMQLATKLLDQPRATMLAGTQGGRDPFFSPDGQWIGFFSGNRLNKISVEGGAPVMLAAGSLLSVGASWGDDGTIVAGMNRASALVRVPAGGGSPQPLTRLGPGETTHRWPQMLPGAKAVLFTASGNGSVMSDANIEAVDLKTGAVRILQRGGYYGRYLPGGYLVYVHEGALYGVAFNPERLELSGTPVPLLDDVAGDSLYGGGQFAFAPAPGGAGMLVYLPGKAANQAWSAALLDNSGKMQPLIAAPGTYYNPAFSPDGRRLALDVNSSKGVDIFVYDLDRETMTRLSFDGISDRPVWTPDGMHIVYHTADPEFSLWSVRSDGSGAPQLLRKNRYTTIPWSISPDGRRLAYWEMTPGNSYDIAILPLDTSDPDHPKAGEPESFLRTPASEYTPVFSPDGRWIAYASDEASVYDIYVRPSSGDGGKWQISTGGGLYPQWTKDGRELFYETADNRIMVVDYTANGPSFIPGKPRVWSNLHLFTPGRENLKLAPDGRHFVVFQQPETSNATPRPEFLLNFLDEVKRRIPLR